MKAYQAYKDSGISWIGQIPKHWEVKRIYPLLNRSISGVWGKDIQGDDNDIACIRVSDFNYERGAIESTNITYRNISSSQQYGRLVTKGNLLLEKSGGGELSPVGRVVRATHIERATCSNFIQILEVKCDVLNANYLYYYFHSIYSKKINVLFFNRTTGIQNLKVRDYLNQSFPFPPLSEQVAIVSYLEDKTAKIDCFISKKEEQIFRLKELREAIIAQAVTRGIQSDVALRPSGVSWLGDIPKHWEVKRLGLSFKENKNLNSSLECTEAYKFNYGTLVRKDEGVNFEELAETYVKYTLLQENDIVINGLNLNYDFVTQRVALATQMGIITSSYLVLSPREGVNHHYYSLLFKAMDSMKLFHGMGSGIRLTLSYKDLKNQALPLPPLSEQEAIIAYITEKTEQIDQLIESYRQEIERVKELKQGLISDAVLGRINVQTE